MINGVGCRAHQTTLFCCCVLRCTRIITDIRDRIDGLLSTTAVVLVHVCVFSDHANRGELTDDMHTYVRSFMHVVEISTRRFHSTRFFATTTATFHSRAWIFPRKFPRHIPWNIPWKIPQRESMASGSMGPHGCFHEAPWSAMEEFHGTFYGTPWGSMEFREVPWHSMEYSTEFHGIGK